MKIFLLAILLLLAVVYAGKYERSERRAVLVYYSDDKCRHLEGIAGTFVSNAQKSIQSSNRGTCREQLACVHNDASEDCHDVRNYGANVLVTFNLNRESFLVSRNNGAPANQTYDTCYASTIFSACHYKLVREREALRRFDDDEWRHHGEHHGHWDNDRYDNDDHWDHDDDHHGHGRPHGKPGHGKPGRPHGKPDGKPGRPHGKPDGKPGRPHGEKPGHVQPEEHHEIHHGEHHEHHGHGRPHGKPGHGKPDHHDRPDYDGDRRPDWAGEWDREREDDDDKKRTLGKNIVEEVKVAQPVTTTATAQN